MYAADPLIADQVTTGLADPGTCHTDCDRIYGATDPGAWATCVANCGVVQTAPPVIPDWIPLPGSPSTEAPPFHLPSFHLPSLGQLDLTLGLILGIGIVGYLVVRRI